MAFSVAGLTSTDSPPLPTASPSIQRGGFFFRGGNWGAARIIRCVMAPESGDRLRRRSRANHTAGRALRNISQTAPADRAAYRLTGARRIIII